MIEPVPVFRLQQETIVLRDQDGRFTLVPEWICFSMEGRALARGQSQDQALVRAMVSQSASQSAQSVK